MSARRTRAFFVARSGVLTLAYEGFSETLLDIKDEIDERIPELQPENPGSRWPKTTLAALKPGMTLTRDDVYALRRLCDNWNDAIHEDGRDFVVDQLAVVLFINRSLERRMLTAPIALQTPHLSIDPPPSDHAQAVHRILDQFELEHLADYMEDILYGPIRSSDYRMSHPEATLVYDLPQEQPFYLRGFSAAVERTLPDYYDWFSTETRHVTVRALSWVDG